jgi:hypothetical protein
MGSYLSATHLAAAEYLTEKAREIENASQASLEQRTLHRACVTAAVVSAVAFLESAINDFYYDCGIQRPLYASTVPANGRHLIARIWTDIERSATLEKYQIALVLSGQQEFSEGARLIRMPGSSWTCATN